MNKIILLLCLVGLSAGASPLPKDRVDVYYFHNTFRCLSCNTVESLTKAAIFGGKGINTRFKNEITVNPIYKILVNKKVITFQPLNVDIEKNKHFLKDFKTETKYPVLVLIKDNKVVKVKTLDDAWNLMYDNPIFIDYIQKNLNNFIKELK